MTMRLGTQTGSAMNHIYSRMTKGQPVPEVGMGATVLLWSDRHAATITAVEETRPGCWIITVQEDKATVTAGSTFDGSAEYSYEPNPLGWTHTFRFDPRSGWAEVRINEATGRYNKVGGGNGILIGQRREYRDPSF